MSVGLIHFASGQVTASLDALQAQVLNFVRSSLAGADRRRAPRHDLALPVRVTVGGTTYSGVTKDLSRLGMRLQTIPPITTGDEGVVTAEGLPPQRFRTVADTSDLQLQFEFADWTAETAMATALAALLPAVAPQAEPGSDVA
jgi:hypothetical protein